MNFKIKFIILFPNLHQYESVYNNYSNEKKNYCMKLLIIISLFLINFCFVSFSVPTYTVLRANYAQQ